MKANELRIGNYVQDAFNINVLTVVSIHEKHIHVKENVSKWGIEFIFLTEEWINRFNESLFSGAFKYDITPSGRFEVTVYSNYIASLEYVHEYQNFYFAIMGEDLSLKK